MLSQKISKLCPYEISFNTRKWLVVSLYNPNKNLANQFIENISLLLDFYLKRYEFIILIRDMNLEPNNPILEEFMADYNFHNLMKVNTCFKSSKGSCIDLILCNKKFYLQHAGTFETGLSDWHVLIYTGFKSKIFKNPPKEVFYRNYSKFYLNLFLNELHHILKNSINCCDYNSFGSILSSVLDKHAPIKKKILRRNDKGFFVKKTLKEIWKRSRLKNISNKTGKIPDIENYKRQRNVVKTLVKKDKKYFFHNIEIKGNANLFGMLANRIFLIKPYILMINFQCN